jgi:diguanylate cyclase (GGDEF)-like protein
MPAKGFPMHLPRRLVGGLPTPRICVLLGILAPLGMLILSGAMLLQLRQEAWEKAEQNAQNLLRLVANDIGRNVEILDLSLQGVIENLRLAGIDQADAELRHHLLFHRTSTARSLGMIVVLDEHGDLIADSLDRPAQRANFADRDYFRVHRDRSDAGLFISRTFRSRLSSTDMIGLSRRVDKPDGSFGGIVLATLKLSYFAALVESVDLGLNGAVGLLRTDGIRLMRHPSIESDINANLGGSENFKRILRERQGGFTATGVRDGVRRFYAFRPVGDLPLIAIVARGADDVEAEWRGKAVVIGATMLLLSGLTAGLAVLFGRELRRRAAVEAELARLSLTDGLTGLPNRRRFDAELARVCDHPGAAPFALLLVDADHFKRINDRHGHAAGDAVLKALARGLAATVHRPEDLVCRIGGEEFAVLLPATDAAGAFQVAERIHQAALGIAVASAGIAAGSVTVSVGMAAAPPGSCGPAVPDLLYAQADAALYEAKAAGRNRTRCAPQAPDAPPRQVPQLRLVEAP